MKTTTVMQFVLTTKFFAATLEGSWKLQSIFIFIRWDESRVVALRQLTICYIV